ncbi:hypothetical protein Rhow_000851 [Rhodococcus wratislaviensis]|uniref:Uncharacterized protein n=1 Tax=Rhodococcus wratislaviensis TaxID=44752 RepID=A0A402C316_RHOWR|nr:hypothetical protein Rhow_000851 [Rhodococcus wratislaviensis]
MHYAVLFRGRGLSRYRAGGTFEGGQLRTELSAPGLSEAGPDVPYVMLQPLD